MKKFFAICVLAILLSLDVFGQDPVETGRIVFYREYNYAGSGASFRIYMGDSLLVRLRNNTYMEHFFAPGQYQFSVNRAGDSPLNLRVEAGETYYIRLGFRVGLWSSIPELLLVDAASALPALESGKMKQLSYEDISQPRPGNRIGLNLAAGFGFKNHPLFVIEGGGESKISLGGGVAIGLRYGREFGKYFDLSSELNYQFSTLRPPLNNADVTFSRGIFSLTPAVIIPIRDGEEMRLKLGAGVDYHWGSRLKIESSGIQGGFNDTWKYQQALGGHGSAIFEMNLTEKSAFVYGLKLYFVNHTFDSSERFAPHEIPFPELMKTPGSGIDLVFGYYLYF